MSTYEPGTVAVATVRGVPNVRVIRRATGWASGVEIDGTRVFHPDRIPAVTDVRPLVVLDLGDLAGIRATLQDAASLMVRGGINRRRLAELIDQIEQQTRPPKPAEPTGLGAVVEDAEGQKWLRVDWVNPWSLAKPQERRDGRMLHGSHVTWDRIDAVKVLSEGVQS